MTLNWLIGSKYLKWASYNLYLRVNCFFLRVWTRWGSTCLIEKEVSTRRVEFTFCELRMGGMLLSTHSLDPCLWGGGSPIIPLLVHQPAYPSITPAGSVHESRGDNNNVQCGAYVGAVDEMVCWCCRGSIVVFRM